MDAATASYLGLAPVLAGPLIAAGLAILLGILNVVYNILLHPLRGVPGPKLWAASRIPYTLAWLSGRLGPIMLGLHEKYGDVVRVGPNRLSFTHPDAYRDIRGHRKAGHGEHAKDPGFFMTTRDNILGAARADHARFRRILSHGFSAKGMHAQKPLITRHVDLLMHRLRGLATTGTTSHDSADGTTTPHAAPAVADLAAWFNFATFDIIGDLSFGEPFGCLETSAYHPWVEALFRTAREFGPLFALEWHLPWLLRALKALASPRYVDPAHQRYREIAAERVAKRLALGPHSRPDFVEAMATAETDDGQTMTRAELVSNARLLVLAGSETTATALAATAYLLATHPRVQKRLAEEVRSCFAAEDEIDFFSVSGRLPYMLAVLDESLRMFPPVPAPLPRVCQPGGDVICGYPVPGGTALDIWPWAVNYCSRNFTEPQKFIPERWLDDDEYQGQRLDKARHHAFQPFSVGPRNCIGKNLAYVEMRLILARLLWRFDLALADQASERFLDCKSSVMWIKGPLNVRLIPRVAE